MRFYPSVEFRLKVGAGGVSDIYSCIRCVKIAGFTSSEVFKLFAVYVGSYEGWTDAEPFILREEFAVFPYGSGSSMDMVSGGFSESRRDMDIGCRCAGSMLPETV